MILNYIKKLVDIGLTKHEWKVALAILSDTCNKDKPMVMLTLNKFVDETGLGKPHICRALKSLKEKNIINDMQIGSKHSYSLNLNHTGE